MSIKIPEGIETSEAWQVSVNTDFTEGKGPWKTLKEGFARLEDAVQWVEVQPRGPGGAHASWRWDDERTEGHFDQYSLTRVTIIHGSVVDYMAHIEDVATTALDSLTAEQRDAVAEHFRSLFS